MARALRSQGQNSYGTPGGLSPVFPSPIIAQRAPTTSDTGYALGQEWVDNAAAASYLLTQVNAGSATWVATGGGSSALSTLTGDTGTATPVAGNIQIAGTVNQIDTLGSGSSITLSLDSNLIAPGSIAASTSIQALEGNIHALNVASGGNVNFSVQNLSNTAASDAFVLANVAGTSAGDAYFWSSITGGQNWVFGTDNSDSDAFVVSNGSALGTGNIIRIDAGSSIVSFPANNISMPTAGTALIYNVVTASGASGGTVNCNGRVGSVTFTGPSIAAAATQSFVIGNTAIAGASTRVMFSMTGATTGAAIAIQGYTSASNQVTVVVENGTGATTQTGNLTFDFVVLN